VATVEPFKLSFSSPNFDAIQNLSPASNPIVSDQNAAMDLPSRSFRTLEVASIWVVLGSEIAPMK
jgi:hypothetical protein